MIFINPDSKANRDIPNIGLALSASLSNVKVIDLNTMPKPADRFLNQETDILGISVQSRTYDEALRLKGLYRKKYPGAAVKSISGFLDVQCCYPYASWEDDLKASVPFGDTMPFPDYDLFDSAVLFRKKWLSGKWRYALLTSLGCPFSCTYCAAAKRKVETRSIEHCMEELRTAQSRWRIKKFIILDDCFNASQERVLKFCDRVRPLGLAWGCANGLRADRFDEGIAEALHSSGCDFISFGVESTDADVLSRIRKGETFEQIERAVRIAQRYFTKINGYFIIGLPGSTYDKDLRSLSWALQHNMNAHFSYYIPFDKQAHYSAIFYGEGAEPVSAEYAGILQRNLFKMTACMRSDYARGNIRRAIDRLLLILRVSPGSFLKFVGYAFRSKRHA